MIENLEVEATKAHYFDSKLSYGSIEDRNH